MTVVFCRSRRGGRRCTRELDHRGLHRHRTIMWADAGADDPRCTGSGAPGAPAELLSNGFPAGRALCPVCLRFIPLVGGRFLDEHDTAGAASAQESLDRADWFNTHGWSEGPTGQQ
ncbi:hypothetical protein [Microbacterium sp. NPDC064584]|uniref:hypothetical protein n=1 Tax=Microbacterium sp. NPDC064584 TaxID=3155817 RepID=UPI00343B5649